MLFSGLFVPKLKYTYEQKCVSLPDTGNIIFFFNENLIMV